MAVNGYEKILEFEDSVNKSFLSGGNSPYISLLNRIAKQKTPVVPVLVDGHFDQLSYKRDGRYHDMMSGNRFGMSITFVDQNEPLVVESAGSVHSDHFYERELRLGGTTLHMIATSGHGRPVKKFFALSETSQAIASSYTRDNDRYSCVQQLPQTTFEHEPLTRHSIIVGWDEIGDIPNGDNRRFRDYFEGTPATVVGAIADELPIETRDMIEVYFGPKFDPEINTALLDASRDIHNRFGVSIDNIPVNPPVISV